MVMHGNIDIVTRLHADFFRRCGDINITLGDRLPRIQRDRKGKTHEVIGLFFLDTNTRRHGIANVYWRKKRHRLPPVHRTGPR